MTINIIDADVFVEAERCGYMAHGCNMQGAMGAGVALTVRLRYPQAFKSYSNRCGEHIDNMDKINRDLVPGGFHLTAAESNAYVLDAPQIRIFHLFTQIYPGKWARSEYIQKACTLMLEHANSEGIEEIAMPYLIGCGYGGLKEREVMPVIETVSALYPEITLTICKIEKNY